MDKGAHYYRADFQIHTPRDPQWHGGCAVSHADRVSYAKRFVQLCREKMLSAVGITDHHDMCLAKYVQMAAQDEEYDPNTRMMLQPERQNPVVFPGMELLLGVPCQTIILLDPDSTKTLQDLLVVTVCGELVDEMDSEGPETKRLRFETFAELDEVLQAANDLKEKYIILPLVADTGGRGSILRRGFHKRYIDMPCVGGYVDGTIEGHGKLQILNGEDERWGNKAIGVFQTSDYRGWGWLPEHTQADPTSPGTKRELGSCVTWVKMAVPTTEALRQACLARQSRIKQKEPTLPGTYITRIEVSDSLYMGPIDLHLNRQFNAIIGGRGTGKSTILEYLRFAMQDQPPERNEEIDEFYVGIGQKRHRFIEQTLTAKEGTVNVHWVVNGVRHLVTCDSTGTEPLVLKIGDDKARRMEAGELRRLLPIQAYSQKQLSTVGTRTDELRRFLQQPIQEELNRLDNVIRGEATRLSTLYERFTELNDRKRELAAARVKARSLAEQAKAIQGDLPDIGDDLTTALKENPLRLREKQFVEEIEEDLSSVGRILEDALVKLSSVPRDFDIVDESPQKELLREVHSDAERLVQCVYDALEKLQKTLAQQKPDLSEKVAAWKARHEEHERLYTAAEQGAKQHQEKLDKVKGLRVQEADLQKRIAELQRTVQELYRPQ